MHGNRIQEEFALSYWVVYYLACCQDVFEYLNSLTYFYSTKEFRGDSEYRFRVKIKRFADILISSRGCDTFVTVGY